MKTSRVGVIVAAFVTFWLSGSTAQAAQPRDSVPPPDGKSEESPPPKPKPKPRGSLVSPEVLPDGHITFRLMAPKAEKVTLICESLRPQPLAKDDSGVWSLTVGPVPPGIYEYQFEVDGVKIADPANPNVFGNRQGPREFVEVPGPAGHPRQDEWRDVPHGTVTIHWYTSKATGARRRVHVYTPPGYQQETGKHYPVLYLLHGSGDNDSHWMLLGRANVIADNLIADGRAVPMIIVMPDGHVAARDREAGGRTPGRSAFEKDLLESVLPLVEANYRVLADAQHRGISGLSMGAGQAMQIGFGNLDKFAYIGAFSGGGRGRTVAKMDEPKPLLVWMGAGSGELGRMGSGKTVVEAMNKAGIKAVWFEAPGTAHEWETWRKCLYDFAPRLFQQ
jgi:enterochelin esterase family protein